MEIFKNDDSKASKEFEKLLDTQFSKTQSLVEGKIIEGIVTKVTEKFAFLDCGLKSEPILDINELKTIGLEKKIKVGEKIPVLLERLEDREGNVVVSASKAQKIKGWDVLVKAYEQNEPIILSSSCWRQLQPLEEACGERNDLSSDSKGFSLPGQCGTQGHEGAGTM